MAGADADQLDELGRRMAQAADHLDSIRTDVNAALSRAGWEGDDAADFHGLWTHRLSGLLQAATTATRDASGRLQRNADQQRQASATDGGTSFAQDSVRPGGIGPLGAFNVAMLGLNAKGLASDWLKVARHEREIIDVAEHVNDIKDIKYLKDFKGAVGQLGPLAIIGAAADGAALGSQIAHGKILSRETLDATVDIGFDIAEVAFPPSALVLGTLHAGFDFYEMLPDSVHKSVEGAVVNTAKDVAHVVADVGKAEVKFAGDVISGGVKKIFGL